MQVLQDRPPLFFPVPQAMMEAGADAAIASLAGLIARDRDGLGQRADVSARIAAMMGSFGQALVPGSGNPEGKRSQGAMAIAGVQVPRVYECADGYTLITIGFGPVFGQMTQRLAKWAAEEGHADSRIAEINWPSFIGDLSSRKVSPSDYRDFLADRIGCAFGSNPETWLGMQMAYDLWAARRRFDGIRVRTFKAA